MPDDTAPTISSPCVGVCTVDPDTKSCIGCLRTLDEIGAWRVMTIEQKAAVIAELNERRKSVQPRDKKGQPLYL